MSASLPPHHRPDGRFRSPWPEARDDGAIRKRLPRVVWEWLTTSQPPDPEPEDLPVEEPEIASPGAVEGELRVTWVGHATHLIQLPGVNVVTDPMWSRRASPIPSTGTARFVPAIPDIDSLPPIHAVLLSHDHFDHLDRPSVVRLHQRFGDALPWFVPLGYRDWFARLGIEEVVELDWWEDAPIPGSGYRVVALPARHWTRRTPWGTNTRLWCSWAVLPAGGARGGSEGDPSVSLDGQRRLRAGGPEASKGSGADAGRTKARGADGGGDFRVYFGGDSAYASVFGEIGRRLGPFDASILPIGAYEPRWFMKASHMTPEEAVQAYEDLGGEGAFLPSHWGTFRLTFEDPLEPPERLRAEWASRGLDRDRLHVTRHGETVRLSGNGRR